MTMSLPILVKFFFMINFINYVKSYYVLDTQNDQISDWLQANQLNKNQIYIIQLKRNAKDYVNKPILRINYDVAMKKKKLKENRVMQQHEARMKAINNFMKDHMITTKYLYDEVKRIEKQGTVKDDLRLMVEYLERPENGKEKELVLKYFKDHKKVVSKTRNVWDQPTNDLVINVLQDPFNDGTMN